MRSRTVSTLLVALIVVCISRRGVSLLATDVIPDSVAAVSKSGCTEPNSPVGGTRQFYPEGDTVHYCCKPYYNLVGTQDADCTDGQWSSPPPICVVDACELAAPFKHGSIISRFSGGLVEFRCRKGFKLDGPQVLACIEKEWNGTQPDCIRVVKTGTSEFRVRGIFKQSASSNDVLSTDVLLKEKARKTHDEWLDEADYSCIKSSSKVVLPPDVPHSRHQVRWNTHDGRPRLYTTYQCTWGFVPVGTSKNLYCSQGMWIGVTPKCVLFVRDDELLQGDIVGSAIPLTHDALLRYADYTCIGPHLEGGSHLPPSPDHGRATLKFTILEGRPHLYSAYTCNDGYLLKDVTKAHMYCKNTAWIGEKPTCVPAGEKDPCFVNNGGCQQTCGTTGQCSCRDGFTLTSDERTCDDTDECLVNNGECEHLCDNDDGGYQCTCYGLYQLNADGKTCLLPVQPNDARIPPLSVGTSETKQSVNTSKTTDVKEPSAEETPEEPLAQVKWTVD